MVQNLQEQEFPIRKLQFPIESISLINTTIKDFEHIKWYQETDFTIINSIAKSRKTDFITIWNSIKNLSLKILITPKPLDIPNVTYANIEVNLNNVFSKYRIKTHKQYYSSHITR